MGRFYKDPKKYGWLATFQASGFHGDCRKALEERARTLLHGNALGDVKHIEAYPIRPPLPTLTLRAYQDQQLSQQQTPKNRLRDNRPKEGAPWNAEAIEFREKHGLPLEFKPDPK